MIISTLLLLFTQVLLAIGLELIISYIKEPIWWNLRVLKVSAYSLSEKKNIGNDIKVNIYRMQSSTDSIGVKDYSLFKQE